MLFNSSLSNLVYKFWNIQYRMAHCRFPCAKLSTLVQCFNRVCMTCRRDLSFRCGHTEFEADMRTYFEKHIEDWNVCQPCLTHICDTAGCNRVTMEGKDSFDQPIRWTVMDGVTNLCVHACAYGGTADEPACGNSPTGPTVSLDYIFVTQVYNTHAFANVVAHAGVILHVTLFSTMEHAPKMWSVGRRSQWILRSPGYCYPHPFTDLPKASRRGGEIW
jgi:hypothetical protein